MTAADRDDILVIKLGALGDFVQALGPFRAIRDHHAGARVTLLTTAPYAELARASGLFDAVWLDDRPRLTQPAGLLGLRRRLRGGGFRRVYDLQTSDRSSFYYRLFWPGPFPEWSGIAGGCSHPHANPARDAMHTIKRQAEQLAMAGIDRTPPPDLSWATADLGDLDIPDAYALLMPGGAAHRPGKRWPAGNFAALANAIAERGVTPLLIGGADEAALHERIIASAGGTRSLAGRTSLLQLAVLARGAWAAVGNDTGPMHVAAVAGALSVVLYSDDSDPALCAQRGPRVTILRAARLADLAVDAVVAVLPPPPAA